MPRLLRGASVLLVLLAPLAAASPASEAWPGCEEEQPWILYRTAEPLRQAHADTGVAQGVRPCEGEHWDGEDPLRASSDPCSGALTPAPGSPSGGVCMDADPNARPGDDAASPAGARASGQASGAAYASVRVAFVGRVALYADGDMVALYARDDTPSNLIASLLRPPSTIPEPPADSDCDQATYQDGAMAGDQRCGRDNTAVTLEHGLRP